MYSAGKLANMSYKNATKPTETIMHANDAIQKNHRFHSQAQIGGDGGG